MLLPFWNSVVLLLFLPLFIHSAPFSLFFMLLLMSPRLFGTGGFKKIARAKSEAMLNFHFDKQHCTVKQTAMKTCAPIEQWANIGKQSHGCYVSFEFPLIATCLSRAPNCPSILLRFSLNFFNFGTFRQLVAIVAQWLVVNEQVLF